MGAPGAARSSRRRRGNLAWPVPLKDLAPCELLSADLPDHAAVDREGDELGAQNGAFVAITPQYRKRAAGPHWEHSSLAELHGRDGPSLDAELDRSVVHADRSRGILH